MRIAGSIMNKNSDMPFDAGGCFASAGKFSFLATAVMVCVPSVAGAGTKASAAEGCFALSWAKSEFIRKSWGCKEKQEP